MVVASGLDSEDSERHAVDDEGEEEPSLRADRAQVEKAFLLGFCGCSYRGAEVSGSHDFPLPVSIITEMQKACHTR